MAIVHLGIGSNVGDRNAHIEKALGLLREHEDIEVLSVSSFIETDPEGGVLQDKFLNGALTIKTSLTPLELLQVLKNIERRCGRQKAEHNAPRTMDLDILYYDDVVIVEGKTLTIPHAKVMQRYFVLKPLSEIAPNYVHPRVGKTVQELLQDIEETSQNSI